MTTFASFPAVGLRPVLAAVCALLLGGCASAPYPPAPMFITEQGYNYVIGPGDALDIAVWQQPELSRSVVVRPDGLVTLPLVEDLAAAGKSPTQLARDVEKTLAAHVAKAQVAVMVTEYSGSYSEQVRVVGEVAEPRALVYKQHMTALDVMIAVGGLTSAAAGNRASILRTAEGNKQYSVRLDDLVKRGNVGANVEMRSGDVLMVPRKWYR